MAFQKAKREQVWTKLLLAGPSGSGKTYTALRLAKGIANKAGGRVAAIDTENGRIRYYADEFDFDDLQLDVHTPESYIEAINEAVDGGYSVLIIDSATHEWDYCLETHNKMPGNSYTNWAKITPRHDAFMETILQTPIHIIATVRGKDEYVLEEKNGKQTPKKVGIGFKQRDNTEYNFTVTFNLAQDTHVADAMKDNTHIFEGRYEVLTEKDGEKIYDWANSGERVDPKTKPVKAEVSAEGKLAKAIEMIDVKAKELIASGIPKADVGAAIMEACGTANYKKITDIDTARKTYKAMCDMTEVHNDVE